MGYDASKEGRRYCKLGGKACSVQHLCAVGKGDSCLVRCRPKAVPKEGSSGAGCVNVSISVETARNT